MKRFLSLTALLALGAQAQEIVDKSPFWAAFDDLEPAGINDLYNDLNLPDTMKKYVLSRLHGKVPTLSFWGTTDASTGVLWAKTRK